MITRELATQLEDVLYDYQLLPFVTTTLSTNLSIINLIITKLRISNFVVLNNNLKLILTIIGDWTLHANNITLINLENLLGYYRVARTSCLQLKIQFNIDTPASPPDSTTIYLDNTPVGYYINDYHKDGNDYMMVTSEMDSAFEIGNRLNLGSYNIVFQIMDMTRLGEGTQIVLDYIKPLKITTVFEEFSPSKQGVYRLEPFYFNFPEDSILETSQLQQLKTESIIKSNHNQDYLVRGTLKPETENSNSLEFDVTEIPDCNLGYQLISFKSEIIPRDFQNDMTKTLEVIMTDLDDDGNIRVYLREIYPISVGQWVKAVYRDAPLEYLQIISVINPEYLEHGQTICLRPNNDNDNNNNKNIINLKIIEHDIILERGIIDPDQEQENVTGYLTDGCLRSQKYLPISSNKHFQNGFIIKIGQDIDGRQQTTSELNIIDSIRDDINEGDLDNTTEYLILKYPLVNSRLQGTEVKQLYPYYLFNSNINKGATAIYLTSEKNITSNTLVTGCINWLSNYLVNVGETTTFISEEPVYIKHIKEVASNQYCLTLQTPINNVYLAKEAYLVLFVDFKNDKLVDNSPTTINYHHNNQWYTGFRYKPLEKDNRTFSLEYEEKIIINSMDGDNIPVFGLSESDIATRGMHGLQRLDIATNMEHLSDFLTAPTHDTILETVVEIPDFFKWYQEFSETHVMVVKGRYSGRGGLIRRVLNNDISETSIQFANILANRINTTGMASCYLSRNLLANELKNASIPVLVRTIPIRKDNCLKDITYDYFYLCSPELTNIQITNGTVGNYKALDGWSFLNNSNYPSEELGMRQKSMSHYQLLNNIFAKIQVNTTEAHYSNGILYNTFVPGTADFTENPLREINSLKFVCLWPDGQLVDFDCRNHSFTLEITERLGTLKHINPINGEIQ